MARLKPNLTLILLDNLVFNSQKTAEHNRTLIDEKGVQPTVIMTVNQVKSLLTGLEKTGLRVKDNTVIDEKGNVILRAVPMSAMNYKVTYYKYHPYISAARTRAGGPYYYTVIGK